MSDTRTQVFPAGAGSQSRFRLPLRSPALVALLSCAVLTSNGQTGNSSTIYRLNQDSTFQQGCFAPCECPVMLGSAVKGTFVLTPTGFDGQFNTYAVSNVQWAVAMESTNKLYTGQGTYKVGGGQQELSLYLQEDGGTVQHFDSGLVQQSAPFPDLKVTISIHGQVCFDTVFGVSASPVHLKMISSGANVILMWPTNASGLALQSTTNLGSAAVWSTNSPAPVLVNGQYAVTNPVSGSQRFFRLRQ
jgi:hypothetical protein